MSLKSCKDTVSHVAMSEIFGVMEKKEKKKKIKR